MLTRQHRIYTPAEYLALEEKAEYQIYRNVTWET
jgi:hypothetical protein